MLGRRLGASDGRRTRSAQLLPQLGSLPFSQQQKSVLNMKGNLVQSASPWIHPSLSSNSNAPSDANSFTVTPQPSGNLNQPWVAYPAPGAGAVTVISFTVPPSKVALIRYLSVVHYGGNDPSGTGQVIWRVLQNGGGIQGLNALSATFGTFAAPKVLTAPIIGMENDTIIVTAEVPAGFPPVGAGAGTGASFDGFTYALSAATSPLPGSF
jgi:hypothetical protein